MAELGARSFRDIFESVSSTAPAPGGGAVSALCGMLGISLILKGLRLSLRKRDDAADYADVEADLVRLADLLEADADADSAAYAAFIHAAKLPRASDGEKAARRTAIDRAAVAAADAALTTLEHAGAAIVRARRIETIIAANVVADLLVGRQLLETARIAAVENVATNLVSIKDALLAEAVRSRLAAGSGPA